MWTETEQRKTGRGSRPRGRHAGAAAGLAVLAAAGLLAATATGAQPPAGGATMFVHSAKSSKLGGGRLTLHGVSRRVTWAHHSGRTGVLSVRRLHRRLFLVGTGAATGTLHVAGHRGGDELTFRLTRPRYNAGRHTVSYKVKRLGNGRLPSRAAHAAAGPPPSGFGPASLSIVASAQDSPTLTVDNSTASIRSCGSSGSATCWGTLSASGLRPGATLTVSRDFNCCEADDTVNYLVDQDGTKNVQLPLPCNNDYDLSVRQITVSSTDRTGQAISTGTIYSPGECVP
jgi:hypothetical protein